MKIILIVLYMLIIILTGCSDTRLCQYQDNCISTGITAMPCCIDVGLINPFTYNYSTTYTFTNMCCYPSECSQSKNNPEVCTCIYMVECKK